MTLSAELLEQRYVPIKHATQPLTQGASYYIAYDNVVERITIVDISNGKICYILANTFNSDVCVNEDVWDNIFSTYLTQKKPRPRRVSNGTKRQVSKRGGTRGKKSRRLRKKY